MNWPLVKSACHSVGEEMLVRFTIGIRQSVALTGIVYGSLPDKLTSEEDIDNGVFCLFAR